MRKALTLLTIAVVVFGFAGVANSQVHFVPEPPGQSDHNFFIDSAALDGADLSPFEDEIGIFDVANGDICVGAAFYNGIEGQAIGAQAAHQLDLWDGFIIGNEYTIRVYSSGNDEEYDSRIVLNGGVGEFTQGGVSFVSLYAFTGVEPYLSVSQDTLQFDNTYVGQTSAAETFTLTNNGDAVLTVNAITVEAGFEDVFTVTVEPAQVGIGQTEDISVTFSPQAIINYEDIELNIDTDDPINPDYIVYLNGTGLQPLPEIVVSEDTHDFGPVFLNTTETWSFTFENTGGADYTITDIVISDAAFEFATAPLIVGQGDTETYELEFTPTVEQTYNATITFSSDELDDIELTVSGQGVEQALPEIEVSPLAHDFGEIAITTTDSVEISIDNIGNEVLNVTVSIDGDGFSLGATPTEVAVDGTETFKVYFAPEIRQDYNATVTIDSDDADEATIDIDVSGSGGNYFEPVEDSGVVYLVIVSDAYFDLAQMSEGDEVGIFDGELCVGSGVIGADFPNTVLQVSCYGESGENPGYTNGNQMLFEVLHTSDEPIGQYSARGIFNDGNGNFGFGALSEVEVYAFTTPQPEIAVSPREHDFGEVFVGQDSAPLEVTISNTGDANLTVSSIEFPPEFDGVFEVDDAGPFTILPDADQIVNVTFSPAEETAYENVLMTINSDDPVLDAIADTLSGTGVSPQPQLSADDAHAYGDVFVGDTEDWILEISNTGDAQLIIANITSSNPGIFYISEYDLNPIDPEGSINVTVTFEPGAEQQYAETITITSNDPNSPFEIDVTGNGVLQALPEIVINQAELDFGTVRVSVTDTLYLRIENEGLDVLQITDITSDNAAFVVVDPPNEVAANSIDSLEVQFTPDSHGDFTGILTVESNDADEGTINIDLLGTGGNYYTTVEETGLPYAVIVTYAQFIGSPLEGGDEIGVFDVIDGDSLCVGAAIIPDGHNWQEDDAIAITCWRENEGEQQPGFQAGDTIVFEMLHLATPPRRVARAYYTDGNGTFGFGDLTSARLYYFNTPEAFFNVNARAFEFGEVLIGNQSEETLTVINRGDADLTIFSASVEEGFENVFAVDIENEILIPAMESSDIGMIFTPLEDIDYDSIEVTLSTDDPVLTSFTYYVSGTGLPLLPELVAPDEIDFGTVTVGESDTRNLTITNTGDAELVISNITTSEEIVFPNPIGEGDGQILPPPIQPGEDLVLELEFFPQADSTYSETLEITSNDGGVEETVHVVALLGTGSVADAPDINLSVTEIDFDSVRISLSVTDTLYIRNTGNADLNIQNISLGDNADAFTLNNNPTVIAEGDSAALSITFTAIQLDSIGTILTIESDDPDEASVTATLWGVGVSYYQIVEPTGVAYAILINSAVIDNVSLAEGDQIGVFTFDGEDSLCVGASVVPPNFDWEEELPITAWQATQLLPGGYTVGDSIYFQVFDYSTFANYDDPSVEFTEGNGTYGDGVLARASIEIFTTQDIELNRTEFAFGNVSLNTANELNLTISNVGILPLEIISAEITGDAVFTTPTFENVTINEGQSEILTVTFEPTEELTYAGTLTITSDDPDEPVIQLALSGTGIEAVLDVAITNIAADSLLDDDATYTVNWTLNSSSPISYVELYYSVTDGFTWTRIDSLPGVGLDGPTTFDWTTPADTYAPYAALRVHAVNEAQLPANDQVDIQIGPFSLEMTFDQNWYMMSVPLHTTSNSFGNIFSDFDAPFFIFDYSAENGYQQPTFATYAQGYWLAVTEESTAIIEGDPDMDGAELPLEIEWNIVGSFIPSSVPRDSLKFRLGEETQYYTDAVNDMWITHPIFGYDPETGNYPQVTTLDQWEGYWILAIEAGVTMVVTPPYPLVPTGVMAVGDDSRANDKPIKLTDFTESSDREDELDETIWSANLNISRNDLSDRLSFGLNPNATDAYDPWLDTPHAPVSASNTFISASFIHDDWQPSALGRLSEEYRGQDDDGFESWDIEIIQDEAGEISLVLDDIVESIPFEYFVYADIGNTRYDLREEGEVRFFAAEREIIQILLTTSETSVGEREDAIPTEYSIRSVYPNPFNPTLHISVALPEATTLHTQVYDMLGREVATIDHGRLAAGYHQFNWDAQVPSGIYFVRISSAEWNDVRKVMLMK